MLQQRLLEKLVVMMVRVMMVGVVRVVTRVVDMVWGVAGTWGKGL